MWPCTTHLPARETVDAENIPPLADKLVDNKECNKAVIGHKVELGMSYTLYVE